MSDLLFQQLSTVQNNLQPTSTRIAAAATIAPTTFITFVSGTTNVATITPPVTGNHQLVLIFTNASPGDILTTGNCIGTTNPAQNIPVLLFYDTVAAKYYSAVGGA